MCNRGADHWDEIHLEVSPCTRLSRLSFVLFLLLVVHSTSDDGAQASRWRRRRCCMHASTCLRESQLTREQIPGSWISWAHTVSAYIAFVGSLIVGVALHYYKIVQNEHWGYPQEWFPSVSATIGDRYPERSVFQIFIAICSGPRFMLVFLFYCLTNRPGSTLPKFVAGVGVFRTLTCGGWTYVTSTDDHDWHDIFMISYLVATLPWTIGCLILSPPNPTAIKYRKWLAGAFFGTLVPLIYFFIQHKVHRVAGGEPEYLAREVVTCILIITSIHYLRLLRMGPRPPRCRL